MSCRTIMTAAPTVEIFLEEYEMLVREAEKIAAVERLVAGKDYASVEDILKVLGIEERKDK